MPRNPREEAAFITPAEVVPGHEARRPEHRQQRESLAANLAEWDGAATDARLVEVFAAHGKPGRATMVRLSCSGHDTGLKIGVRVGERLEWRFAAAGDTSSRFERSGYVEGLARTSRDRRLEAGARVVVVCHCGRRWVMRPVTLLQVLARAISVPNSARRIDLARVKGPNI